MENINKLLNEYNAIQETLRNANDEGLKNDLQTQLNSVNSKIKLLLEQELSNGNTNEELIELCSKFDVITDINEPSKEKKEEDIEVLDLDEEDKKIESDDVSKEDEPLYTLASTKITSLLTGEEIDISNMSRIEKVKIIYEHTGVEISEKDPEILKICDQRFKEFLRICPAEKYMQKYGEDWEKVVEQQYKSSYLSTTRSCIGNALNEVDRKRREEQEQMEKATAELNKSNEDIKKETKETEELIAETKKALGETDQRDYTKLSDEEKQQILNDNGVEFVYDENKRHGLNIDNERTIVVNSGTTIEEAAKQMMVCKLLGIKATMTFNGREFNSEDFTKPEEIIEAHNANLKTNETPEKQPVDSIGILDKYKDIVKNVDDATKEEISAVMDQYTSKDEHGYTGFSEPLTAELLNNRYKDLTGVNHPMYDKHQLNVVNAILARQDDYIRGGYNPEYLKFLESIKENIESSKTNNEPTIGQR